MIILKLMNTGTACTTIEDKELTSPVLHFAYQICSGQRGRTETWVWILLAVWAHFDDTSHTTNLMLSSVYLSQRSRVQYSDIVLYKMLLSTNTKVDFGSLGL